METINCRFSSCQWSGETRDLLEHCDADHNRFVKFINEDKGFTFQLKDVLEDAFLLCGGELGLFWFLRDPKKCEAFVRRGVFSVKDVTSMEYTAKIGQMGDEMVTYLGPYFTSSDEHDYYDMKWSLNDFKDMEPSKVMEVCFGEFEEVTAWIEEECDVFEEVSPYYCNSLIDLDEKKTNRDAALFEDYIKWKLDQPGDCVSFSIPRFCFSEENEDLSSDGKDDVDECYRCLKTFEKVFLCEEDSDDLDVEENSNESWDTCDIKADCEDSSMPRELEGFDDLQISEDKDNQIVFILEGLSDDELEDDWPLESDNCRDPFDETDQRDIYDEKVNWDHEEVVESSAESDTEVIEQSDEEDEIGEDDIVNFEHVVVDESVEPEVFLTEDDGFDGYFGYLLSRFD